MPSIVFPTPPRCVHCGTLLSLVTLSSVMGWGDCTPCRNWADYLAFREPINTPIHLASARQWLKEYKEAFANLTCFSRRLVYGEESYHAATPFSRLA